MKIDEKMREDAMRRDFTVNALYEDRNGRIFDPTEQGIPDAHAHVLRFVGTPEKRIQEDNLRILRLFRLAASKPFDIALSVGIMKELWEGCRESFKENVSGERIGKEMKKLFAAPYAPFALGLMDKIGMLDDLVVGWNRLGDLPAGPHHPGSATVKKHTFIVLNDLICNKWEIVAAGFFHDIGKGVTQTEDGHALGHEEASARFAEETLRNWRIESRSIKKIVSLVQRHMDAHQIANTKRAEKVWKFVAEDPDILKLLHADCCDVGTDENDFDKLMKRWEGTAIVEPLPKPTITGVDLIEAGCKPGPEFARALEVAFDFQLRAEFHSREFDMQNALKQSIECYKQLLRNRRKNV